jgi:hypothetical protein
LRIERKLKGKENKLRTFNLLDSALIGGELGLEGLVLLQLLDLVLKAGDLALAGLGLELLLLLADPGLGLAHVPDELRVEEPGLEPRLPRGAELAYAYPPADDLVEAFGDGASLEVVLGEEL